MKQVVVQAFCDLCAEDQEVQVPATDEATFEGHLLDLCDDHAETVAAQIERVRALFAVGVETDQPAPRTRKTGKMGRPRRLREPESVANRTCPDCGYTCPTRSALGGHIKLKHGKRLSDYDWSKST